MKPRCVVNVLFSFVFLFLLSAVFLSAAPPTSIRLRNDVITPDISNKKNLTSAEIANEKPASGLFLIQFTDAPQPAWREELKSLGVDLLHYIPDDAFVAKFNGVRPGQVQNLSYVRWVGAYQPEYRIHPDLLRKSSVSSTQTVGVAVLFSPDSSETDFAQAKRSLKSVRQESNSRAGRVLRGMMSPDQVNSLAQSDSVLWIEPAPDMKLNDEVASRIVGGDGPPGQSLVQSLGYTGDGVTVAVADSGLDSGDTNDMHPDIAGRVAALFFYGLAGQLEDAADEHSHGTHVAGIIAGNGATGETDENGFLYGLGVAPGASLVAQRIFDANGNYAPPPSFETMTRDARRAGAEIGSNSWGDDTQGRYDISAMEFDALVRDCDALALGDQPYILEFSAGNAGPNYRTVGSPAVAKNVIATGASQNDRLNLPIEEFSIYADGPDAMADFSSRGPCEDGRIKPDLVAPGSWIASLRSIYANDGYAWWPISDNYMYQGGTSQAGPHVSGAAAVFVQYYRNTHGGVTPSPALVKAALINSAADMDDGFTTDTVPNMDEGWGRVDLAELIASSRNYEFVDQTTLLTNGAVYEKRILVGSSDEPLKVTLTYTDVPGLPAAVIALVNDLDLEVQAPDGHVYHGNQFVEGESVPDSSAVDTINNVEAVHLYAPVPGEYVVRVRGSRVVQDARQDTGAVDQDFALVVSASIAPSGVGIVTFNKPVYRVPDEIKLTLVDYDLAGQSSASVVLRSSTQPAGTIVVLQPLGTSGLFTGAVATATTPVIGALQISHGDTIEAVYSDASPAADRVFSASADLLPPVISNVEATNRFGQVIVSWDTDENSKAIVYYGTNELNLALTNSIFDLSHEFMLPNIPANTVVKFMVVAEDKAGNRSTNDNNGQFFSVTSIQSPSILLIDSYTDNSGLVATPPLSGYTDALNALGVAYDVFDAREGPQPTPAELQAHRTVIWRVDEISAPNATLAGRITDYVHNGGSLLIASMEAVTRFTEAGLPSFNTDVLQVQSYTEDEPVNEILGSPGDPVGLGIDTTLDYSPYADLLALLEFFGVTDPSDWIAPTTNATAVLLADGSMVGVRSPKTGVDLPGRVVYLSFPLDAVPMGSGVGNNRPGLLRNILDFLAPQPGSSSITLDSDVYSVPGRAVVEVEDPDMQGQGQVEVSFSSPEQPGGVSISLAETARSGLFRGSIIFTPTDTGIPGTLHAAPNDTVQAGYFDESAGQTFTVTATIETNAPIISGVYIEPGYLEAIVSWETSKDADALVQYSESPNNLPNNYTAYDATPGTYHELFLSNLKPNTTYYSRVVSRDRAGNTTTDDNDGQFYTFTTLQPQLPPWQDNMETNNSDWSVITAEDSEMAWTRGVPGGGETANSPVNCWGSNLGGGPVSLGESYLISPGILLSGGNRATLRFSHNYDFAAISDFEIQLAAVEIITNIATEPLLLVQLPEDSSFGWEDMEIDLTPYMGNVVYIVWYHFLFSIDEVPRLGWLVDDASITVDNIVPGTIQITNNLWQSVFALSGPTGTTGHGRWTVLTNAPPGKYVLQFGDVLHYATPSPQTNDLVAGGKITFQGNYTFADANGNGIPDPWELEHFGVIDPSRTASTDTDGDGMSDAAEAIAGTDPNNPPPAFRLTAKLLGNGLVQLSWPSVTNHTYRVHGSVNATMWSAYSNWLPAGGTNTTFTLPQPTNGAPYLFRVEAAAPTGPNALPASLKVTAALQSNGSIRLEWPSSLNHGYRIWGSSDAINWSPASDWIQASAGTTGFELPIAGSPRLFRVEVAP